MRSLGKMLLAVLLFTAPGFAWAGGMHISSPDFANGGAIPAKFTCQGKNVSPALEISGVPARTESLVLIVDDPDAPSGTFTHWIVWNIPPGTAKTSSGSVPGVQGFNDFGKPGYGGPCPPSGTHRYFFRLMALNVLLTLKPDASRAALDVNIKGHVIGSAVLMGRFSK